MAQPNRKRTKNVSFRLTDEEYELLMERVGSSGLSLSGYAIDRLIHKKTTFVNPDGFRKLAVEVRRVGNNINQLTKRANSGEFVGADEIQQMKGEYEEVWQQLKQYLQELR